MDENIFNKATSIKDDIKKYEKLKEDFSNKDYPFDVLMSCLRKKNPDLGKSWIERFREYIIVQCEQQIFELEKEFKKL